MDFPIDSMVIFHSYVTVYQRVPIPSEINSGLKIPQLVFQGLLVKQLQLKNTKNIGPAQYTSGMHLAHWNCTTKY